MQQKLFQKKMIHEHQKVQLMSTQSSTSNGFNDHSPITRNIHEKYLEFLNTQNKLISQIFNKSPDSHSMDRLQEQTSNFIRNLMDELTDTYGKLRKYKFDSQQQISQLNEEVEKQKEMYNSLKQQFYITWEDESEKYKSSLEVMEKQHRNYQNRISELLKEIERNASENDELRVKNYQLSKSVSDLTRQLRKEREFVIEHHKEFKGMENLIEEYQLVLEEYQQNKLRQESTNLRLQNEIKEKERQIERIKVIISENEKNENLWKQKKGELQSEVEKVKELLESKEVEKQNFIKHQFQQSRMHSQKARQSITKINVMFKTKEKLLKKVVESKMTELRKEQASMKKVIQKEMLIFWKLMKADILGTRP